MATQSGILGLRGKVGGLVFRRDGAVSQAPGKRASTSARTLENGSEFGSAATAGKRVRNAFRSISQSVSSKTVTGRMTKAMRYILGLDSVNARGLRQVLKANIGQLVGFSFSDASLSSVFFAPYTSAYGAGAKVNTMTVSVPNLTPTTDLSVPQGATHYQLVAAAAQINFVTGDVTLSAQTQTAASLISGTDDTPGDLDLVFPAAPGVADSTIVAVGVVFFQEVNGSLYPLNNGANNALAIVAAA